MAARRTPTRNVATFAQTPKVSDVKTQRAFDVVSEAVKDLQSRSFVGVVYGETVPEGRVSAALGTFFVLKTATTAALYFKESGADGPTGWVLK